MKTFRKLKKGFTIVELVIVIAIIAILAAVLVPTFANLIDKANQSADTQLVRNLNTILISEETAGTKPTFMGEVLALEEENGYKVENLQAKAKDYKLVWNPVTNRFYKAKVTNGVPVYETYPELGAPTEAAYTMWTIDSAPSNIFSTYLYQYQATEEGLNITTGLDVGNETVASIQYVREESSETQNVVIRTNSSATQIHVNAPNDNISFYGEGIIAEGSIFANQSAHIYGEFSGSIARGRVVYHVLNSDKVIVAESTGVIVALSEAALTSEHKVDIKYANGVEYYYVQTTTNDGEKITQTKYNIESNVPTATETEDAAGNSVEIPAEITESVVITQGAVDPADIVVGLQYFAGGTGTESDPFLIVDFDTFKHVNDSYNEKYTYYKVKDGITEIDMTGWTSINLTGYIEGNNVTLKNLTAPLFQRASYDNISEKANTIKHTKIEANIVKPGNWVGVVFSSFPGTNLLIDDVDLTGYVEGGFVASYICQDWTGNKIIKDSTSSVTLFGSNACGGMTGYIGMGSAEDNLNLTLENSKYDGTMIRSANSNFTYLGWNNNGAPTMSLTLDEASANAAFTIKGAAPEAKTYTGKWNDFGNSQTVYTNEAKKVVGNLTPSINSDGKIEVNAGTGTKAVATLMIGPNPGNMYAAYMTEEMKLDNGKFITEKINGTFTIQIDNTKETGFISNSVFNLKYNGDGTIHCANILITIYDSMGNVINVGTIGIDSSRFPH